MLTWVLAFVLTVFILLAIPVRILFDGVWPSGTRNEVSLHWGFGLIRLPLPMGGAPEARKAPKKTKSKKKLNFLAAFRQQDFRQRLIAFVGDLWRAIGKENLRLKLRVGLGDPADTGLLWAVLGPVAGIVAATGNAAVSIEPDFFHSTLELDGSGKITVVPLRVIGISAAMLLSPAFWNGYRRIQQTSRRF